MRTCHRLRRDQIGSPSKASKVGSPAARRQIHPLVSCGQASARTQKPRANLELRKNEGPITPVAYALASEMASEIDMENAAPGQDLGLFYHTDKLMELMSIEEFQKENPFTPPPPRRTMNPLRTNSKNGQFAAEFQWACDARGIPRDFVYHTVAQGCFDVELRLNGDYVDRIGQYASKKDAKEEICKKHLATVELITNSKKRKVTEVDCLSTAPAGFDDELWVNLLYGNFLCVDQTYTCMLTFHSQSILRSTSCLLRTLNSSLRGLTLAIGHACCASRAVH